MVVVEFALLNAYDFFYEYGTDVRLCFADTRSRVYIGMLPIGFVVDEGDDFRLVGAQSCIHLDFIESGHVYVAFASSVPSNGVSNPMDS